MLRIGQKHLPHLLSGFYRQAAMQFLFMAEGELKIAERQTRRRDK
jgi:hypothetical protein